MKIIKKITVDFNKANTNVVALEVRQGDTGGRYIPKSLTKADFKEITEEEYQAIKAEELKETESEVKYE